MSLPRVEVVRYVTPLREGGSLPGVVEGEDDGTYVCKFRGAGQGLRVLVAEVIVAGLAARLGLDTPRQVVLGLDAELARFEADEEVQDLLRASVGDNLGIDFLPGSFGWDGHGASTGTAARVLWLDAFCANVDRSWRNPNLLRWGGRLWVIDHGASLYFHHSWTGGVGDPARFAAQPYDAGDHVLGPLVDGPSLAAADEAARAALTEQALSEVIDQVPDQWLEPVAGTEEPAALREAYRRFLIARLGSRTWLPEVAS